VNFVPFLKTAGKVIATIIKVAGELTGVLPIVETVAPKTAPVLDKFQSMLKCAVDVEGYFTAAFGPDNKTGSQKLAALTPAIAAIVQTVEPFASKRIQDPGKFQSACTGLASNLADLLNSVGD
jgi:hypothetical protein